MLEKYGVQWFQLARDMVQHRFLSERMVNCGVHKAEDLLKITTQLRNQLTDFGRNVVWTSLSYTADTRICAVAPRNCVQ